MLFSAVAAIYLAVVLCVLLYKAWAAIQGDYARTTPGKAVGFLFIPVFNLYWLFQAFWGYARDYNKSLVAHQGMATRVSDGMFLSLCIVALLGIFLGLAVSVAVRFSSPLALTVVNHISSVASGASLALGAMVVSAMCDATNYMRQGIT